jgi:hypothetical protein
VEDEHRTRSAAPLDGVRGQGADFAPATDQIVLTVVGGPYPSSELPPGVRDAVGLEVNTAGQVEWFVTGPDAKRGIIPAWRRAERPVLQETVLSGGRIEEPAADFAVRFDHKGCPYEYLDMFNGTSSLGGGGRGPVPFVLSQEQRTTLFKAIIAAGVVELPAVMDASGGEPAGNYELDVRNGGKRHLVSWRGNSGDRSLNALVQTVLDILNPHPAANPGSGCGGGLRRRVRTRRARRTNKARGHHAVRVRDRYSTHHCAGRPVA